MTSEFLSSEIWVSNGTRASIAKSRTDNALGSYALPLIQSSQCLSWQTCKTEFMISYFYVLFRQYPGFVRILAGRCYLRFVFQ